MSTRTTDELLLRLSSDPQLRERLRVNFGRTLAEEGLLNQLSIADITDVYGRLLEEADPVERPR